MSIGAEPRKGLALPAPNSQHAFQQLLQGPLQGRVLSNLRGTLGGGAVAHHLAGWPRDTCFQLLRLPVQQSTTDVSTGLTCDRRIAATYCLLALQFPRRRRWCFSFEELGEFSSFPQTCLSFFFFFFQMHTSFPRVKSDRFNHALLQRTREFRVPFKFPR